MIAHTRPITIDGVMYRWKVLGCHEDLMGWAPRVIQLVVENPVSGASFITGRLFSKRFDLAYVGQEDNAPTHHASVTPKDVEKVIRHAISDGWKSTSKGRHQARAIEITDYIP